LDTPESQAWSRRFLDAYKPERVVIVGEAPREIAERYGVRAEAAVELTGGKPLQLWNKLLPNADRLVVCPATPRAVLLQAACVAGQLKAPLYLTNEETNRDELLQFIAERKPREILAVGAAADLLRDRSGVTPL